jgi:hypothetical protein
VSFDQRRNTAALASTVALTASLALVACGSSSKSSYTSPNAGAATTGTSSSSISPGHLGLSHTAGSPPGYAQAPGVIQAHSLLKNPTFGQALTRFSACMRQHGIAGFPQPNLSGRGSIFQTTGLNTSSPQFGTALTKCRPEMALTLNHLLHSLLLGARPPSGQSASTLTTASASR